MNDKEAASRREILQQGQNSDFWRIITDYLKESKEHLRKEQDDEDLKSLPAEQYKVESELLKAKIKYLDRLADYPNTIIGWLQTPDSTEKNYDPYDR